MLQLRFHGVLAVLVAWTLFLPLSPGFPDTGSPADSKFETMWSGREISENKSTFERFQHFPVVDGDGDGFVSVTPLPIEFIPNARAKPGESATDTDINTHMVLRGITREDIATQVNLTLQGGATWGAVREAAVNHILNGQYVAASLLLIGSPAEIIYFCGADRYYWYIGAPFLIHCNHGVSNNAVSAVTLLTGMNWEGGRVDDLRLLAKFQSLNPLNHARESVGVAYQHHNLGVHTRMNKDWFLSASLMDLSHTNSYAWFNVETNLPGLVYVQADSLRVSKFDALDYMFYSLGYIPNGGKIVRLYFDRPVSEHSVGVEIEKAQAETSFQVRVHDPTAVKFLHVELQLSDDQLLAFRAAGIPRVFKVGWEKQYESSTGDIYLVRLEEWNRHPMWDLEIKGTYYKNSRAPNPEPTLTFQLSGFPGRNLLRYVPGNGEDSCDNQEKVFSLDLTKTSPVYRGHYRALLIDGHVCAKGLQITANDIERFRMVGGKQNPFEEDGNTFVMLAGTMDTSRTNAESPSAVHARAEADPVWGLEPEYVGDLFRHSDSTGEHAHWTLGNNHVCMIGCEGDLNWGGWSWVDTGKFNGYFWSIDRTDQLALETCILRYADGVCA